MTTALRCSRLEKTYPGGVEAVRGLDLEVQRGECFGLLGPNGAGKATTVEILEGLLPPTAGEVEVLGRRWGQDDDALRHLIGISLQETKLAEKLTVEETLRLFASFYDRARPIDEVIAEVALGEKRTSQVGKLSGGQQQRLALACALVSDPEVLFLDEPTTGLDPQSRRQLWDVIRGYKARGRTILLTTHYMDEAERLCDRVAVVDHGKVIAQGTPAELISRLGGEHVVEFSVGGALDEAALAALPAVKAVRVSLGTAVLTVSEVHVAVPALLDHLKGRELTSLTTRHASLEDVFVSLTGRHLRDD